MPNRLSLASNGVGRGLNLPDSGDKGNLDSAGQQCRPYTACGVLPHFSMSRYREPSRRIHLIRALCRYRVRLTERTLFLEFGRLRY